jgi:hypothetical protein
MKTSTRIRMVAVILFLTVTSSTWAYTNPPVTTTALAPTSIDEAKMDVLLKRMEEIKTMDKSNLSRAEKKALRIEARAIKATAKATRGRGLYISLGAVIIIILLLIIIL